MALPVIASPDVEDTVQNYLQTKFAASPPAYATGTVVRIKTPATLPTRLVVIRRDGGPRLGLVFETARLSVRVWAATDADATDLANYTAGLLLASPGAISSVTRARMLSAPAAINDEAGLIQRFSVFELEFRGTQL